MKLIPIALLALLLVSTAPLPDSRPALPPATLRIVHRAAARQPQPTPAVTISGEVTGQHRLGYAVPLGVYTAYGATLGEATQHAEQLEQQIRAQATAQAVAP
jgi:hypothetical protein